MEVETKGFRVDLTSAAWRKSSRSGPNCDNCVEVAFAGPAVAVRDSKNPARAALIFAPAQWRAFIDGTQDGQFNLD